MEMTERKFIITLSRYLKRLRRENKELNIIPINLNVIRDDDVCKICFDGNTYVIKTINSPASIIRSIANECGCRCDYYETTKDNFELLLFKKPLLLYDRLVKLIQKRAGINLAVDDVKTEYNDLGRGMTDYLCYNSISCQQAITFIQDNKFRNDKVNIEFGNNNNNKKYIRIIITKPKGKKVECEVFA